MEIDSELCHVDTNKIIVRISASRKGHHLGSALGEGKTVEEAENNAMDRLNQRVEQHKIDIKTEKEANIVENIIELLKHTIYFFYT